MAIFRQIHTSIWKDLWFEELTPDEKLLFIYLFSNESSSIAGIYEISMRVIAFETGLEREFITRTFEKFEAADKIQYDQESGILWVKKMRSYHETRSDTVQTRIQKDIKKIHPTNRVLIGYLQDIDEVSIPPISGGENNKPHDSAQSLGLLIPYAQDNHTPLKQSKTKQTTTKKKETKEHQITGGGVYYVLDLWGIDKSEIDAKTTRALEQLIDAHGEYKVTALAQDLSLRGFRFRSALGQMEKSILDYKPDGGDSQYGDIAY